MSTYRSIVQLRRKLSELEHELMLIIEDGSETHGAWHNDFWKTQIAELELAIEDVKTELDRRQAFKPGDVQWEG